MESNEVFRAIENIRDIDTQLKELYDMRKKWERLVETELTSRGIKRIQTLDKQWEAEREIRIRVKPVTTH